VGGELYGYSGGGVSDVDRWERRILSLDGDWRMDVEHGVYVF